MFTVATVLVNYHTKHNGVPSMTPERMKELIALYCAVVYVNLGNTVANFHIILVVVRNTPIDTIWFQIPLNVLNVTFKKTLQWFVNENERDGS